MYGVRRRKTLFLGARSSFFCFAIFILYVSCKEIDETLMTAVWTMFYSNDQMINKSL
jgi:hypothetical protein